MHNKHDGDFSTETEFMAKHFATLATRSHQKQAIRNMVHLIHGVPQAGNAPKTERSVSQTAPVQACTCGKVSSEYHAIRLDLISGLL